MAFICEPGAHRHRPQQSKTANTDTNMCTQTHTERGLIPHIYIWHIIADSVLLWPWQKLYSQTYYTNRSSEQELNRRIKIIGRHLKSRWFIGERPRYDSVTLVYNLHIRHKFECFGNKRQIRTILATPPKSSEWLPLVAKNCFHRGGGGVGLSLWLHSLIYTGICFSIDSCRSMKDMPHA